MASLNRREDSDSEESYEETVSEAVQLPLNRTLARQPPSARIQHRQIDKLFEYWAKRRSGDELLHIFINFGMANFDPVFTSDDVAVLVDLILQ